MQFKSKAMATEDSIMDEQPVGKKRACDSFMGEISHDVQSVSVDHSMNEVCASSA